MNIKVKWHCTFPEHWKIFPSKRLFPESKKRAPESDEQLSATQDYGVIAQAKFMRLAGRRVVQLNQHLDKRKRVEVGNFVISMRSFQGGLERAWTDGGIRSSYVVLKPRADLVLGYYQRLFKSQAYIQALQSTCNFIRDGQDLNYQNFVLIDLPFPPLEEQKIIADFLDRETTRIDALIAEQQRLIELLKEKRQAVISHAVTKGLDPTVPMKDSGVEWLGEVPAHWVVCKLSYRYSIDLGKMLDEKKITGSNLVPYLRNQDVQWNSINTNELPVMDIYPKELDRYTVKTGDLLVCEGGEMGRSAIWREDNRLVGYQKALHRLRAYSKETDTTEFFFFSLLTAKELGVFEEAGNKTTFSHLPAEKFRQHRFVFPPLAEQQEIASFLNEKMKQSDTTTDTVYRNIELLQERRSALISAAVTGKIDLRHWQAPASDTPASTLEAACG